MSLCDVGTGQRIATAEAAETCGAWLRLSRELLGMLVQPFSLLALRLSGTSFRSRLPSKSQAWRQMYGSRPWGQSVACSLRASCRDVQFLGAPNQVRLLSILT